MNRLPRTFFLFLFGIFLITAVGCEREGPAERAGERIDRGVERTGDAVEDATRR
jgi:hypothetical protein